MIIVSELMSNLLIGVGTKSAPLHDPEKCIESFKWHKERGFEITQGDASHALGRLVFEIHPFKRSALYIDAIKEAIAAGGDIRSLEKRMVSPALSYAHNRELVNFLLAAGADLEARDRYNNSALHLVALDEIGLNNRDDDESKWNASVLESLIDAGADINARNDVGQTPLHYAKTVRFVQLLITAGADINAQDIDGKKPDEKSEAQFELGVNRAIENERLARQEALSKAAGASIEAAFSQPIT